MVAPVVSLRLAGEDRSFEVEEQLRGVEDLLEHADASTAAAIAVAAICRIGEIGDRAGFEFAALAETHRTAGEVSEAFLQGCEQIDDAIANPNRIIQ